MSVNVIVSFYDQSTKRITRFANALKNTIFGYTQMNIGGATFLETR